MQRSGLRLGDFELRGGRVFLAKTGNSAPFDGRLIAEVASWLFYYLCLRAIAFVRNFGRRRPSIWFVPDRPHPRYLVRSAAIWAGIRIAAGPERADAAFFFEDATRSEPHARPDGPAFNFGCTDISKSRVAEVFETVFGYPLAVDPRRGSGQAVEKSEANGAHDGRIVSCPIEPVVGKVYQRLIDTLDEDGHTRDLRTHSVGGQVLRVWIKKRAPHARFLPPNLAVETKRPDEVYNADELALIRAFTEKMGADWCALDVLRDRDGRLYIVDVNKTDAGPIIALPLREKLASTALLGNALLALITHAPPV